MIKLAKRGPQPPTFLSQKVKIKRQALADQIKTTGKVKSTDFPSYWLDDDIRTAARKLSHGKCCYCERKRDAKREPDIEHFRPKAGVEAGGGHPGYWWLAYNWKNLFFACKTCNQEYKKNKFPVDGVRASGPSDSLSAEQALLLDPTTDDPEASLSYDWEFESLPLAKPHGTDNRGSATIEICGLDRPELSEERGELLLELRSVSMQMILAIGTPGCQQGFIDTAKKNLKSQVQPERQFAGFRRAFFRAFGLGDYVDEALQ